MAETYTTNHGLEKPEDGSQVNTWGATVNVNSDIIDAFTDRVTTKTLTGTGTTGAPNTLSISDGVVSEGHSRGIIVNDGGDLGGDSYLQLVPNDAKRWFFIRNSLSGSRSLIVFQGTYSGGNAYSIPAGKDALVKFDGGGTSAVATNMLADLYIPAITTPSVTVTGGTITGITDLAVADGGTGASNASGARTNLGIGSIATQDSNSVTITGGTITGITDIAVADGGTGASTAADARTNLGLAIGTNVQAYDAGLQSIAGLTTVADRLIYTTASDTYTTATLTSFARTLLDDTSASVARSTLGLVIGTDVEARDTEILRADTDDNLTAGYTSTADNDGTQSSGTYTPTPAGGNMKRIVNGGAFTFAAPTATGDYTLIIQMTNNASAGAITFSGFTRRTGASLTTTDGDDFIMFITKINGFVSMYVEALQI